MTILKKAIELIAECFAIDFRSVHFDSVKKTAFEKGSMYAIERQKKEEEFEFADFSTLRKVHVEHDFNVFLKGLPSEIMKKINKSKSQDEIKKFFTSGYKTSWFCPLIVNRVEAVDKFQYLSTYGKQVFLNLLWTNSKVIEKRGMPLVLESTI